MNVYSEYNIPKSEEIYLVDPARIDFDAYDDRYLGHSMQDLIEFPSMINDRKSVRSNPDEFMVPFELAGFDAIPDFEVVRPWPYSVLYIDVKFERDYKKPEIKNRLDKVAEYLESIGHEHLVITEKTIRKDILLLEHLKFLRSWRVEGLYSDEDLQKMVPEAATTFEELAKKIGGKAEVVELIAKQFVYVDLTNPISGKTEVRAIEEGDYERLY